MTGAAPAEVVTVGETMVVFSPAGSAPLERADRMAVHVGGAESNVAMYLAALGHRAAWASRVGDDPFGRLVLRHVAAAGVDVTPVTVDPVAPTGVYFKDPTPAGTRVHYYRAGSAASRLDRTLLDDPGLAGAGVLHLSGITPVLSDSCRELVEAAVVARGLPGATVSFDVNYRPRLWPVERAAPVLRHLADRADVVFVGLDEAWTLWRTPDPVAVRRLLPGPAQVVVKDGAVGATVLDREGRVSFVPALRVPVVEPVGAGDAFAAGYLSALLRGFAPVPALRWGHLIAAHALGVPGDHAPLTGRAELDELVRLPADRWPVVRLPQLVPKEADHGLSA